MTNLKLGLVYLPVKDLKASLAFYRDALGLAETWREGDSTCALQTGTEVDLMLIEEDAIGHSPGPVFLVDDVRAYYEQNKDRITFRSEPVEIPPGYQIKFTDPDGFIFSIMDLTKEAG